MIDRNRFTELSDIHYTHCISIYMPKTNTEKDRITLKNLIRAAERDLMENHNVQERDAKKITLKIREVSNREGWWRQEGLGLAIFIHDDNLFYKFYPVHFEPQMHTGERLYLLPLAPLVHMDSKLYLLVLSAGSAILLEGNRSAIREHPISSKLPRGIRDVVGYDYEEKSLQYRSGQGESNGGMYHGQGAGNQGEQKKEYMKYFREVDDMLNAKLADKSVPLVVACVDYLFPIYEEVSQYKGLYPEPITGNYDELPKERLRENVIDILNQMEEKSLRERKKIFHERLNTKEASYNPEDIIPAAFNGRVETLFVQQNAEMWGKYVEAEHKITVDENDKINNASLLNLSAIQTINNSGEVFVTGEMPIPESVISANFRYSL